MLWRREGGGEGATRGEVTRDALDGDTTTAAVDGDIGPFEPGAMALKRGDVTGVAPVRALVVLYMLAGAAYTP